MNDSFIPSSQLGAATGSLPGGLWGEPESQVDENGDAFQECDSDDTETVINMPVQNEQKLHRRNPSPEKFADSTSREHVSMDCEEKNANLIIR